MESLHAEVAPFGINTTIVNPGFFRTELLTEQSTNYAEASISDYDERRAGAMRARALACTAGSFVERHGNIRT